MPAASLVRAIYQRAGKSFSHTQNRILAYLAHKGYVLPETLPRTELFRIADHYGLRLKSVQNEIELLVKEGAVIKQKTGDGRVYFAYDPAWLDRTEEPHDPPT